MPKFYLHVCNGDGFTEDREGQELPSVEAARDEALRGLRSIMSDELKNGVINVASFIKIEDENHTLVATVPFEEAVKMETRYGKRPGR